MNGSPSIEHQVALKLISNDMLFARRFIDGALIRQKEKQTTTLPQQLRPARQMLVRIRGSVGSGDAGRPACPSPTAGALVS